MKLLFDQNISFRVIKKINDVFPSAVQVRELGLENATDLNIWEFARTNNCCIVTFDGDFIDISALRGAPPKIIWLRAGNTCTDSIAEVIRKKSEDIKLFLEDTTVSFLEIRF